MTDDVFAKALRAATDRITRQVLGLPPEPTPARPALTLETLREAVDRARPVLHYGLSTDLPRGRAVVNAACDLALLHPDDLEAFRAELPGWRLVGVTQPVTRSEG